MSLLDDIKPEHAGTGLEIAGDQATVHKYVATREIAANSSLGKHKPYGCFADFSNRVVNGKMQKVNTIWLNHNQQEMAAHDNSAPICQAQGACSQETCCPPLSGLLDCSGFKS